MESKQQQLSKSLATIPTSGFLRAAQILGNKKAVPPVPPIIPIGKSSWWQGVREGKYPKPVKLGARTTVWTAESIRELIERVGHDAGVSA